MKGVKLGHGASVLIQIQQNVCCEGASSFVAPTGLLVDEDLSC